MAKENIGKITQIIGAVLDIKFSEGDWDVEWRHTLRGPRSVFRLASRP